MADSVRVILKVKVKDSQRSLKKDKKDSMSDSQNSFHNFALSSYLFKGQKDYYYCFLKADKIACALTVLAQQTHSDDLNDLLKSAKELPHTVLHFLAGEVDISVLLADVFSLLVSVRFVAANGSLVQENAEILVREYEQIIYRVGIGSHPSPYLKESDFSIPEEVLGGIPQRLAPPSSVLGHIDTTFKNQETQKGHTGESIRHKERSSFIVDFVRSHKQVSIKDISAVLTDCSEKTIQRELALLIQQGLIRRVGERRWSVYIPV